jgi:probable HAF family extracellular repeat protein
MRIFGRIALGAGFFLGTIALGVGQSYTITAIGVLKGDNESSGLFINFSGQVVGCSDVANGEGYPCTGTGTGQHAFLWSASGGLKDLKTLPGGNISGALGINDSGKVVGYSNAKGVTGTNFHASSWTSGGEMTDLGTLSGGTSSAAFQVNSSGVVAGDSFTSSSVANATAWTNQKIKNLGALPGSIFTAALAINDSGEIAGESVFSYGPPFLSHAFDHTPSGETKDLGTLPGGTTSMANAINAAGVIVGQSNAKAFLTEWHAAKWSTTGTIKDLGTLPEGTYSVAFGVNRNGQIVGYGNIANNAPHAFLWTSAGGMQDLNDLIPPNSGWVLINANAINDVGQITGYGTRNGQNRAFLLTPVN